MVRGALLPARGPSSVWRRGAAGPDCPRPLAEGVMQGPAWLSLLRRLPTALHDGLIIVTSNCAEIVVQSIVRAERDFLVIRGRMSGSQDTGRTVFVPFDQINYIGLAKKPSEAEVQAFLAKPVAGVAAEPAGGAAPAQA